MLLSGLNPDQALEIANRSISFYTYQLFNENRLKDEMLKRSKEECDNLKGYCASLKAKYHTEIEKLQRSTLGGWDSFPLFLVTDFIIFIQV